MCIMLCGCIHEKSCIMFEIVFIMPTPIRWRRNALLAVICLSVCPVPDHKSRMEGRSELRFVRKLMTQVTGDPI